MAGGALRLIALVALLLGTSSPASTEPLVTMGFQNPVSAYLNAPNQYWYVGNLGGATLDTLSKDGNGFISKIFGENPITEVQIVGLNAPKGIGAYRDYLYVADIDEIVVIDFRIRSVVDRVAVPGARYLNGLAIDPQRGDLYVVDTMLDTIFWIPFGGEPDVFTVADQLRGPAGIAFDEDRLIIGSVGSGFDPHTLQAEGPGGISIVDLASRSVEIRDESSGAVVGVATDGEDIIASDFWSGEVYRITPEGTRAVIADLGIGIGAIGYDGVRYRLVVPWVVSHAALLLQL